MPEPEDLVQNDYNKPTSVRTHHILLRKGGNPQQKSPWVKRAEENDLPTGRKHSDQGGRPEG